MESELRTKRQTKYHLTFFLACYRFHQLTTYKAKSVVSPPYYSVRNTRFVSQFPCYRRGQLITQLLCFASWMDWSNLRCFAQERKASLSPGIETLTSLLWVQHSNHKATYYVPSKLDKEEKCLFIQLSFQKLITY